MRNFVSRLLLRGAPAFSEARSQDAGAIAGVHGAAFQRGWSEEEIYRLLIDPSVVAHCVRIGGGLVGFIVSRLAVDEAEVLSIAVARARRGCGLARSLLDLNLRRLAGLGARTVFLEVDEHNAAACALYRGAGFREAGRRQGYYATGTAALLLRRELG